MKRFILAVGFLAIAAAFAVTPFSPSRPQFATAQGPVTPTNASWREPLSRDAKAAADKLGLIRIGSGLAIDGSGIVSASQTLPSPSIVPFTPAADIINWQSIYVAGVGTPSLLYDVTGNGGSLSLTSGSAPTLTANSSPAGRPSLAMTNQVYSASSAGVSRHGSVWFVIGRPDADGTMLDDTDGWRCRLAISGNTFQFGQLGGEASSLTASRQWSIYFGYCSSTLANPITNQFNTGTAVPGADTNIPGIKLSFKGNFIACGVGQLRATSQLSNFQIAQILSPLYDFIVPPWPSTGTPRSIVCRGNSIMAGVGLTYAQTIPGIVAAARPSHRVASLAISGITTPDVTRIAGQQAWRHNQIQADLCTEISNDVAYGANAGNGTAAGTAALNHIRACAASRPGTIHIFGDCLPRAGTSQAVIDAANLVLSNAFTVATADATVWASSSPDLANCFLVKQSIITPRTWNVDNIHPDAAFNVLIGAKYVAALTIAGVTP